MLNRSMKLDVGEHMNIKCGECGIEIKGMYDAGSTDLCAKCMQLEFVNEKLKRCPNDKMAIKLKKNTEEMWDRVTKAKGDK